MFEDLFDFSDKLIPEGETSSGLITFEEYLTNKDEGKSQLETSFVSFSTDAITSIDESESPGMMTFLEYLETKNIVVVVVEDEEIPSIIKPSIPIESQKTIEKTKTKSLWEGYVQQVSNQSKNRSYVNIQDPAYLAESRSAYAATMLEEQKKIHDQLYFFTGGGHYVEEPEEDICAVIGKAIIGKNKIC
jgi:hypothetical protein